MGIEVRWRQKFLGAPAEVNAVLFGSAKIETRDRFFLRGADLMMSTRRDDDFDLDNRALCLDSFVA